jgi:hypothetical protein
LYHITTFKTTGIQTSGNALLSLSHGARPDIPWQFSGGREKSIMERDSYENSSGGHVRNKKKNCKKGGKNGQGQEISE